MQEQKFYIPALIFSIIGVLCGFFMFGVEAVAAGGIALFLSVKKRETHRVKLSVVLAVIALISGIAVLLWMTHVSKYGIGGFDNYWYYQLFFGR